MGKTYKDNKYRKHDRPKKNKHHNGQQQPQQPQIDADEWYNQRYRADGSRI